MQTPLQKIEMAWLGDVCLFVKREDLIHPTISGNKWRKLKYNLEFAKTQNYTTVVTFGGAFSNHIYSSAAACNLHGLKSIGLVRGEYDAQNPTLQFALSQGMKLIFVSREEYREKQRGISAQKILNENKSYVIPEGGSNQLALQGLKELAEEINRTDFDIVLVSAGTGCTAAGILKHLDEKKSLWVFSSLKHYRMRSEILKFLSDDFYENLNVFDAYHLGGYARTNLDYISFINEFYQNTSIPLDPIYNGKLMYGFHDLVKKSLIDKGKKYLWIHTGGLQGIDAFNYMAGKKNKSTLLV